VCIKILRKRERKKPLEEERRRWNNNIKMDFQAAGWSMDWIDLAQDRDRWRAFVKR
jgi:hypothetical protein